MEENKNKKDSANINIDDKKKRKKWLIIIICIVAVAVVANFVHLSYQSKKKDKVAPVITFNKDTVEITEGEKYDPSENIRFVKDDFDGDIPKADKKPSETGAAYYLIDNSNLDTSKVGEYKVKVTAVDKAGNEASKEFTVKVNEKNEDNSSSDNSTNNSSNSTSNSTNNSGSSSSSNTGTSNSNKGNTSSGNNNSGTSSNKPQQICNQVKTKDAWDEQVLASAAWDETIVDQPAWDERVATGSVVICRCGQRFNSYEEWDGHAGSFASQGDWSHGGYHTEPIYSTVHHDATYKTVHHDAVYTTIHHDAEYTTVCN